MNQPSLVFVTGGSGYLGRALIVELLRRGHRVRALARRGSETHLPGGTEVVTGDALLAESFAGAIAPADTIVHLVGTPRPSSAKAAEFRAVDLASIRATVAAAAGSRARHLVYVSVAQPAIENPPAGIRIVEVPEIRRVGATMAARAGVR